MAQLLKHYERNPNGSKMCLSHSLKCIVNPEKPGDFEKRMVASFLNIFSSDTSAAINSEFKVFFECLLREKSQERILEELKETSAMSITITKAANTALRLARTHRLFKTVKKRFKTAPSVSKNEGHSIALKRVKNYVRRTMSGERLKNFV